MPQLKTMVWSSVGKKVISALTGLSLIVFSFVHLLGNLALLRGDPDPFNKYAHFLMSLKGLIYAMEIGLALFFIIHIVMGVTVWLDKRRARPNAYQKKKDAGGSSRMTISSKTMIYTGLIMFVFLVVHLKTIKYGSGIEAGYVTIIDGEQVRDLYRLVIEQFSQTWYMLFYVGSMILLGYHLRHGFWSAFQSLGVNNPRCMPYLYGIGVLTAIVLVIGFIVLPVWIYLKGGTV